MPSSKVKPPSKYLMHWHECLHWLSERKSAEIELARGADVKEAQTLHRKAMAMRTSVERFPGWNYNVRCMVLDGELHFERRGLAVWAVRRPRVRSISEVLRDAGKILPPGD